MILLPKEHNKEEPLLRIVKQEGRDLSNIFFGHSYRGRKSAVYHEAIHDLTADIVMDKADLKQLAREIKRVLEEQPTGEMALALTFQENHPEFKVTMRFMVSGQPLYRERLRGKVEFSPGFNINYSIIRYTREEDQYLYEDGGRHTFFAQYYYPAELEKFANEMEKETTRK